jgi:RNA polymerase sigma-70 factor (ECF subfamily)
MAGDSLAYQTFLSELTRHLRGFLRRRIPQLSDDVEDLVQEILLAVHNGRHT